MTLFSIIEEEDQTGEREPSVIEVRALSSGRQILKFGDCSVPVTVDENNLTVHVKDADGNLKDVDTMNALGLPYEQDDSLALLKNAGTKVYTVERDDTATYLYIMGDGETMSVERHDTIATLPHIGQERI